MLSPQAVISYALCSKTEITEDIGCQRMKTSLPIRVWENWALLIATTLLLEGSWAAASPKQHAAGTLQCTKHLKYTKKGTACHQTWQPMAAPAPVPSFPAKTSIVPKRHRNSSIPSVTQYYAPGLDWCNLMPHPCAEAPGLTGGTRKPWAIRSNWRHLNAQLEKSSREYLSHQHSTKQIY